jgi:hypothetical protein
MDATDQSFGFAALVAVGLVSVGRSKYFPVFMLADILSLSFAIPSLSDPLKDLNPSSGSSLQPTNEKARTAPAIPKQNRHIGVNSRRKGQYCLSIGWWQEERFLSQITCHLTNSSRELSNPAIE